MIFSCTRSAPRKSPNEFGIEVWRPGSPCRAAVSGVSCSFFRRRQDDNACPLICLSGCLQRSRSVQIRHTQIQEQNVRIQFPHPVQHIVSVSGLAHNIKSVLEEGVASSARVVHRDGGANQALIRAPQPPQNSPAPGSAAPQLVQKVFPFDEGAPRLTPIALCLLAPNRRTILTIRKVAITRRISPRKLSVGIIKSPVGVRAAVPSTEAAELNRQVHPLCCEPAAFALHGRINGDA